MTMVGMMTAGLTRLGTGVDPEVSRAALMAPREGANATMVFMIQMVAIFAIFYFLLIRPQRKEQERHQQMIANVKKGHEIVTAGGIVGKVVKTDEETVTLTTGDNTKLVIERDKITKVKNFDGPVS